MPANCGNIPSKIVMQQLLSADILLCEGFRLDRLGLFRLDPGGVASPVALGSRALDLAWLLADRQGELISKDEILETVWPGRVVEDNNLTGQISTLHRILDHGRSQGSCIQTVVGHGYRFVAAVTRVASEPPSAAALSPTDSLPPLPDRPALAVLPFQNISGDPEQQYFADGMVEEIITSLSRIRWLFVIARNSSFTYKGHPVDIRKVGRELGVRYVLEGSVRKAGSRVRISAQLIDTNAGLNLWADHFDGSLDDIFELQDKVAISVAGIIEPALQAAEIRRSADLPTADLTAYDLYLRALAHAYSWEKERIVQALHQLDQAIGRDPNYGSALALAVRCHFDLHVNGWSDSPETNRRRGVDLARQALQVASGDPNVLREAAFTLAYFGEDIDPAIELIDRALVMNPSVAQGWVISGWLRLWAGQTETGISHFEKSLRLSPHARPAGALMAIGVGHFFAGRFEPAKTMLLRSLQEHPRWAPTYRFLASCYAHMGRLDEAREAVERLRTLTSLLVPNAAHWRKPEHRELYLSGLRLAAAAAS
jgi:TolB-like protein